MDHPDHRFDADYEEVLVLRNGTEAKLRLIRPEDKKLILDGLQSMSPESRYRRFFTQRDGLSESELVYLTELDHEMHFAIGAATTEADGSQVGLGVARFIRSAADPTLAEAAIAVVDSAHGQGLGRQLFVRLVDAAVERNVRTFRCEMLAKNDAMLKLLESLFGKLTIRPESGLVVVDCALPGAEEDTEDTEESPLYHLFKYAAGGMVRLARGVRSWPIPENVFEKALEETDDEASHVTAADAPEER